MIWKGNSLPNGRRVWALHPWLLIQMISALACLSAMAAAAGTAPVAPIDRDTARLLRSWMAGQPVLDDSLRDDPAYRVDRINADWVTYCLTLRLKDPDRWEKGLRRLYKQTESEALRGIILLAIREDPALQSRQAQFVRRYGFYANWFNRLAHTAGRTLQGNVTSVFGLAVRLRCVSPGGGHRPGTPGTGQGTPGARRHPNRRRGLQHARGTGAARYAVAGRERS